MSVDAYPDSSFLVSFYREDNNHAIARAFMQKWAPSLAFLPLHRVELRNALRLAEAQGLFKMEERREAFKEIEQDLRDGFLVHVAIAWSDICRRADELSEKHSARNGQRAIDLLHVAAALESGAKLAGLQVKP